MDPAAIRPRFDLVVAAAPTRVLEQLRDHLLRVDFGCRGWVAPPYAELEVQAATKHFWSPRLAVYAGDDPEGCVLHCRFQPEPNVWTMYMAGWGILVVAGAVAIAWACACLIMGNSIAAPIVVASVIGVLAGALYVAAILGQRLGTDQMVDLRSALDEALASLPVRGLARTGTAAADFPAS